MRFYLSALPLSIFIHILWKMNRPMLPVWHFATHAKELGFLVCGNLRQLQTCQAAVDRLVTTQFARVFVAPSLITTLSVVIVPGSVVVSVPPVTIPTVSAANWLHVASGPAAIAVAIAATVAVTITITVTVAISVVVAAASISTVAVTVTVSPVTNGKRAFCAQADLESVTRPANG